MASVLTAALVGLCHPPVDIGPLILVAYVPWIAALPRFKSLRGCLFATFLTSWMSRLIPLFWLATMTGEEGSGGAMVAMWLFAAATLTIPDVLFAAGGRWLMKRVKPMWWMLLLPLLWAGFEILRYDVLVPSPVLLPGYALHQVGALIQIADLGSVHLVSVLVLAVNVAVVIAASRGANPERRSVKPALLTAAGLVLLAAGYGEWRLMTAEEAPVAEQPLVVVIQPNIAQEEKNAADQAAQAGGQPGAKEDPWAADQRRWDKHVGMTLQAARDYPDANLFIWSETAVPGEFPERYGIPAMLAKPEPGDLPVPPQARREYWEPRDFVPHSLRKDLLFGATVQLSKRELWDYPWLSDEEKRRAVYNSAVVVGEEGGLGGRFDKAVLVPAGEYIPYRGTFLGDATARYMQEMAGYVPRVQPGLRRSGFGLFTKRRTFLYSASICYEYAFAPLFTELHGGHGVPAGIRHSGLGADFSVNLSNEAWYGDGAELDQAVIATRFRAIESRIPFVRATNSGVSCIIDAQGRVRATLTDGKGRDRQIEGVLAARIPVGHPPVYVVKDKEGWYERPLTVFLRIGMTPWYVLRWAAVGFLALIFIAGIVNWFRSRRSRRQAPSQSPAAPQP